METAGTQSAPPATGNTGGTEPEKSNTLIYALGIGIVILLAIGAWYLVSPKQTMPKVNPLDPNDPMNKKIPGVSPGATATGILTDPNFFKGLANLGSSIAGWVKDAKADKQSTSNEPSSSWGGLGTNTPGQVTVPTADDPNAHLFSPYSNEYLASLTDAQRAALGH